MERKAYAEFGVGLNYTPGTDLGIPFRIFIVDENS